MAEGKQLLPVKDDRQKFAFSNVQLLEKEILGSGSYGTVCKAKCDELMCAAKIIFPALFQMDPIEPGREHTHPLRRFEAECYLLKSIDHPNIVQYLGTYRDPDTNAPVLLMELMDESLTHFLESSPGDIPYHIQINLSYDIAQALAFLHSNGIVHRDLSSNNVLILASNRAKITDFGMSKLIDTNIQMTKCPGTPAFMPPEALDEPPAYTEKIDTFSFGVLVIQILTRQFPNPTNRFKVMPDLINPNNPSLSLRAPVAEVQRRCAHIDLINSTQPLLPIALKCLDGKEAVRPTAQRLCIVLDSLKDTPKYQESCQQHTDQAIRAKEEIIRVTEQIRITHEDLVSKIQQLREKEEKLDNQRYQLEAKETEIGKLTHELQDATREIDDRTRQLRETNKQLQDTEQIITQQQLEIAMKETETKQSDTDVKQETNPEQILETEPVKVSIEGSTTIPYATDFDQIAIVDDKAYIKAHDNVILEYSTTSAKWSAIKGPLSNGFSIVSVDNILTTVGGDGLLSYSNKLYCYQNKKWVEKFPPMKCKRRFPAVVYAQINLVVIGGSNTNKFQDQYFSQGAVEVLNTETSQWSVVKQIPRGDLYTLISATVHDNHIYVLTVEEFIFEAGITSTLGLVPKSCRSSLFSCSIANLKNPWWQKCSSIPRLHTCVTSINGLLLAIGGYKQIVYPNQYLVSTDPVSNDIFEYNQLKDEWNIIGQMSVPRSGCSAAALTQNKLMIVGRAHLLNSFEARSTADFVNIDV